MMKKFYITTTLPYVNADPHIGHAVELVQADAYARYFRSKLGREHVFFNTGTDEHGLKMVQGARAKQMAIHEFVEQYTQRFKDFCQLFHVAYDFFYQTSHAYHLKPAQAFWLRCLEHGDIYKGRYEGYYCVGCEYYKTEKDLVDGKCPDHNTEPIWLSEENYFFRLSNYGETLLAFFEQNADFVKPRGKLEEAKNFVKSGLTDISISRRKEALPWGIPVPHDPEQIIYVWFDALTNYTAVVGLSTNEQQFQEWWPGVQICGPDNLRYQSIIWQAMLASAKLPLSKHVLVHGTILGPDGRKMSKTIGNVVSPFEQISKYNPEIVRYYLLAGLPTYADAAYKESDLVMLHNTNLANTYGNLVNRVIVLANKKGVRLDRTETVQAAFQETVDKQKAEIAHAYESYNLFEAAQRINVLLTYGNKYIDEEKPWNLEYPEVVLNNLHYLLVVASELYEPIIPVSSQRALEALRVQQPVILYTKLK
jgi:methionyl-tRNA synthetase